MTHNSLQQAQGKTTIHKKTIRQQGELIMRLLLFACDSDKKLQSKTSSTSLTAEHGQTNIVKVPLLRQRALVFPLEKLKQKVNRWQRIERIYNLCSIFFPSTVIEAHIPNQPTLQTEMEKPSSYSFPLREDNNASVLLNLLPEWSIPNSSMVARTAKNISRRFGNLLQRDGDFPLFHSQ